MLPEMFISLDGIACLFMMVYFGRLIFESCEEPAPRRNLISRSSSASSSWLNS